jgi:hypothetical protein
MFWPFVEIDDELIFCPLAEFGSQNIREGKEITTRAVTAQPVTGHVPLYNAKDIRGNIILMERGVCDFVTKVFYAQQAGALCVIIANSGSKDPNDAFVMAAGRRPDEATSIRIPSMMISKKKASILFERIREYELDREDYVMTIKFLGANEAMSALEKNDTYTREQMKRKQEAKRKQEMEVQQNEAMKLLRSRLGFDLALEEPEDTWSEHGSTTSSTCMMDELIHLQLGSIASNSSCAPSPLEKLKQCPTSYARVAFTSSNDNNRMEEESPVVKPENAHQDHKQHIPQAPHDRHGGHDDTQIEYQNDEEQFLLANLLSSSTTCLFVMDMQNYFVSPQAKRSIGSSTSDLVMTASMNNNTNLAYLERIKSIVVPNLQDLLHTCRSYQTEILYGIVQSSTRDGRDRSRAFKQANIHIVQDSFESKILTSISPCENELILPRTGIK